MGGRTVNLPEAQASSAAYYDARRRAAAAALEPEENAFAESFNGRLRDECLNVNWFMSVKHAREVMESRRQDYNESDLTARCRAVA